MASNSPTLTPKHPIAKYGREDKERFALLWILHGTVDKAAREAGIPRTTCQKWMKKAWWPSLVDVVRIRHKDELESKFEYILNKSADELADRLDNGDTVVIKGAPVRVPVKAKELAQIIDSTHANLRLSRNEATNISVSATLDLRQMASNFARAGRTYQYELNGREKKEPDKLPYFGEVGTPGDDIDDDEDDDQDIEVDIEDDNSDGIDQTV